MSAMQRPDIFSYHDYRKFLADWLAFKKVSQSRFSMRSVAKQVGLASGYLPMILSGKRPLSHAAWTKLSLHLGLTPSERQFFEHLLTLGTSDLHNSRVDALARMKRSLRYQQKNPKEAEVYQYLTHWHYVAIRELATIKGFQDDPRWIQSQLRYSIPLSDVKEAMDFLIGHGFLERDKAGHIQPPQKALDCSGGVYRIALGKFHKEILELAAQSIDVTPSEERALVGHTCTLSNESLTKAQKIVADAIEQIQKLGSSEKAGESVYHMEIMLFPLSQSKRSAK